MAEGRSVLIACQVTHSVEGYDAEGRFTPEILGTHTTYRQEFIPEGEHEIFAMIRALAAVKLDLP